MEKRIVQSWIDSGELTGVDGRVVYLYKTAVEDLILKITQQQGQAVDL